LREVFFTTLLLLFRFELDLEAGHGQVIFVAGLLRQGALIATVDAGVYLGAIRGSSPEGIGIVGVASSALTAF